MSTIGKRVIYVGGAGDNNSTPRNVEGEAVSAVLPGTLLQEGATGLDTSAKSATDISQLPLFADKDQLKSKSVDDAWTIGQNMVAIHGRSGDFLNVLVATGQTLSIGEGLVSNGAGLLIAATDVDNATGSQHIVCFADEALTTAATTLVRVRIA